MIKVFIGIPTINRPELVKETIESVRCQQEFNQPIEIFVHVSDNGSDAQTLAEIGQYVSDLKDARFTFYAQPQNNGEYGQARYFFSKAKSLNCDYFMILHDDDLLNEDYLSHALSSLEQCQEAWFYVANPLLIDVKGDASGKLTNQYLKSHGRSNQAEGLYDVLESHLQCGFSPISGTFFRMSFLIEYGFVDQEKCGNYPFESDVFLRLGSQGGQAWYSSKTLLKVRFHEQSMRNYQKIFENVDTIEAMLTLLNGYTFLGTLERLRRQHLSRLYRALSLVSCRQGEYMLFRKYFRRALFYNSRSIKNWVLMPSLLVPGLVRFLMPQLPESMSMPQTAP